jgi:bifunctional DNA-binding transcriptional regulator/antitoxin component of YhaV-PrlF toxin-antitoxin module
MENNLTTALTARGQISVPAQIRRRLDWRPGLKLTWKMNPQGTCLLQPVVLPRKIAGAKAMLGYARKFHPTQIKRSNEVLRELRAGE